MTNANTKPINAAPPISSGTKPLCFIFSSHCGAAWGAFALLFIGCACVASINLSQSGSQSLCELVIARQADLSTAHYAHISASQRVNKRTFLCVIDRFACKVQW